MRTASTISNRRGLALPVALVAVLTADASRAAVIAVPGDQPTIQRAIDAAAAGDVIRVSPGVYAEALRITGARDGLTIEASDPADPPVVQGKRTTSTDGIRVEHVDDVVLRHLRVADANVGVRLDRVRRALLEDLVLEDDVLGVRVQRGGGNTVRRATVLRTRGRQGILVEASPGTLVVDTLVEAPAREGIAVRNTLAVTLLRCVVRASRGSDGIRVYRCPGARIEQCTANQNARNGLRVSSSSELTLVEDVADRNAGAGLRIERSSPFASIADVLSAGNRARDNGGDDVVVEAARCNTSRCPTTTTSTTTTSTTTTPPLPVPTTTASTTLPIPSTTTSTVPSPPLAAAAWRFSVRIASTRGADRNVDVPLRSVTAPLPVPIRADHLPAFRVGDQVTEPEILALEGDTSGRLAAAADAHVRTHPDDYPDFGGRVVLRWAKRVTP